MASKSKHKQATSSQSTFRVPVADDDDDDFQDACRSLPLVPRSHTNNNVTAPGRRRTISVSQRQKLKVSNSAAVRPCESPKGSTNAVGKENRGGMGLPCPSRPQSKTEDIVAELGLCAAPKTEYHRLFESEDFTGCSLELIESTIDEARDSPTTKRDPDFTTTGDDTEKKGLKFLEGCKSSNSIESRLLKSVVNCGPNDSVYSENFEDEEIPQESESCTQLDLLLKLCAEPEVDLQHDNFNGADFSHHQGRGSCEAAVHCPLCGTDISHLTDESRQVHTNECLDKQEAPNVVTNDDTGPQCPGQVLDGSPARFPHQVVDTSPVVEWLRSLGLAKYEEIFVREEIDWATLQWLTDEDLVDMGITALGPRRKIIHVLSEYRKENTEAVNVNPDAVKVLARESRKLDGNKLITDFFPGSVADRRTFCASSTGGSAIDKSNSASGSNQILVKNPVTKRKLREIPLWCRIPGTPFRVDAFKYLRGDCSHWFLTHFHLDHYQGLTKSFCHGKIYCSLITARLVNMKIGIPWDNLQVLPLNEKIHIAGIAVTCFDANHCPGSVIVLFEPPNGKAVLHTGDFRYSEEMSKMSVLQTCAVQTLILDTTYCNPQYDFPKQEAVIQFVIEAIQAEAFNPKTLFLIGSYTVGKERLFLEVARALREKVYVNAAKLRLLECLGLPEEDMKWFTLNEQESHIHVVPMWTIASFKRLKHTSSQYASRFSLIVAFSPTGWTFGKGKKKTPGRRWQQGTIIRYEVPYSEHCSFTELREFVKFISPVNIIPSVNNDGLESSNMMVSLLLS